MKTIKLIDEMPFISKNIIKEWCNNSHHRALKIDSIRLRVRILDKLDASTDQLELEDTEFQELRGAIEEYPHGTASAGYLSIIDSVLSASDA